jgi:hypothetical protein
MYKEIEEIIKKEKLEAERLAVPVREIKHGFSQDKAFLEQNDFEPVDYLSMIVLDDSWTKKYFSPDKAKDFIVFIFKKYFCFNKVLFEEDFLKGLDNTLKDSDLISALTKAENEFISLSGGEDDKIKEYFLNPYNALFKDENGYYAVIQKGKFSDVKRPFGFNANQMKKIIKENIDEYLLDNKQNFKSDKEFNAFTNSIKAYVNKAESNPLDLETECNNLIKGALVKNGMQESAVDSYFEEKGYLLVKQGNFYFRKKAYDEYAKYKMIEFRY